MRLQATRTDRETKKKTDLKKGQTGKKNISREEEPLKKDRYPPEKDRCQGSTLTDRVSGTCFFPGSALNQLSFLSSSSVLSISFVFSMTLPSIASNISSLDLMSL